MKRKATPAATAAIVTLAAAFGLGQEKYSDVAINQLPVAPVSVATLDIATVLTKSKKFNASMAPIRAKLTPAKHEHIRADGYLPPHKKEALSAETKLYADTYQRMDEIVTRICKARNIGLVIRATAYSVDLADRVSILQCVNKQIVYSDVPDITDEVIAELDR